MSKDGQDVVNHIRQEIIFGRLRPRERLVEEEISAKLGASRHQIRAAFAELESMGLVTRRPNKGAVVRDFSVEEIEQYFETGALLQAEAVKRIPLPLDAATLRQLEEIHEKYCAAIDRSDLEQVSAYTFQFHRVICEASKNKCLSDLIQQIWTATLAIRCYAMAIPVLLERSRQEHAQIIEALRSGNRRELLRLCLDHSWPALDAYMRLHGSWATKYPSAQDVLQETPEEIPQRKAK